MWNRGHWFAVPITPTNRRTPSKCEGRSSKFEVSERRNLLLRDPGDAGRLGRSHTDARRYPAWRIRPLSRKQRSPFLPPGHSRRPGEAITEREEHDPVPDAEGRPAHPDRPVCVPEDRQDSAGPHAVEVHA